MAGIIRPLWNKSRRAVVEAKGASCRYVENRIRDAIEKLSFTADGADLTENEGNVHIKVTAGGKALFAWQIIPSGAGITITPGMILLQGPNSYFGVNDPQNFVPVINGVALDADVAPVLPINTVGPTWVVLEVKISKDGNPQGLPWAIKGCNTQPIDVPLIRPFNDILGQDGVLNLPIAIFQDGIQTVQVWLARPISVYWAYDTILYA